MLALFLLRLAELILELLQAPFENFFESAFLLGVVRLPELVGLFLLELEHLLLEGSDLLVVFILHKLEEVLRELFVRVFQSLQQVFLPFQVSLEILYLRFLLLQAKA